MDYDFKTLIEIIDDEINGFPLPHDFVPHAYEHFPFTLEAFRNCFVMELIKKAYYESEDKHSLEALRNLHNIANADDAKMRDSRIMKHVQYYQDRQYERIDNLMGTDGFTDIHMISSDRPKSPSGRNHGYRTTNMQYFEIQNLWDCPLLKAIASKRICDSKKVSTATFKSYMTDYDSLTKSLTDKLSGTDEDVIFATIALYYLERAFNVELFYSYSVKAEETGTTEVPMGRIALLCSPVIFPDFLDCSKVVYQSSNFILHRMDLLPSVFNDDQWCLTESFLKLYLYTLHKLWNLTVDVPGHPTIFEFFQQSTVRADWAKFIKKHYDLRKIYVSKEWTSERIKHMRKIYSVMLVDEGKPHK